MNTNKLIDFLQSELTTDQPNTTLIAAMKVMQPGIDRLVYDAKESAKHTEREESVCRLLASGLCIEEVTVLLCLRRDEVKEIAKSNEEKISKYNKTLKEREKRHGLVK